MNKALGLEKKCDYNLSFTYKLDGWMDGRIDSHFQMNGTSLICSSVYSEVTQVGSVGRKSTTVLDY